MIILVVMMTVETIQTAVGFALAVEHGTGDAKSAVVVVQDTIIQDLRLSYCSQEDHKVYLFDFKTQRYV